MKKTYIILTILILFFILFTPSLVNAGDNTTPAPLSNLYSKSAALYDADNERLLFSKNADQPMPMASTTKIMTCIIALEYGNFDDEVEISSYAASMPDVQLNVQQGEKYYFKDLLFSLMLESHNDVAVAIAEHIGKKVTESDIVIKDATIEQSLALVNEFAKLMNEKALSLGCVSTNFVTPNGLDADNHYTTAEELARIASYAIKNNDFIYITNLSSYTFSDVENKKSFSVTNKNAFLSQYAGAIGCKTGFTGNAGYCFVGAAKRNNITLISVCLAAGWPPNKTYKWSDTTKLMDYGFNNYSTKELISSDMKGIIPSEIKVQNAIEKSSVHISHRDNINLLLNSKEDVYYKINLLETYNAPVYKDTIIGKIDIYINEEKYTSVNIYADETVHEITFNYYLNKVLDKLTICD